ncbi:odorant receptor 65a [Drosophila eugracilis]|uniref:odorant receptor 65a n=1 Tax=Drosophila eugracilis TaxID=29029 RepID=UPI0007E70F94|nr:odorant receptor 65a [Drosophila eugracilis]
MAKQQRITGNWDRFWIPFQDGWAVFKDPQRQPRHINAYWNRDQLKAMGLYINSERLQMTALIWKYFVLTALIICLASLLYGIPESFGDIVNLGRDLVFTVTGAYICSRLVFFAQYSDDVDMIIDALEDLHHRMIKGPANREVQAIKRFHILLITALQVIWFAVILIFILIKISTPFYIKSQSLPFHVAWPFELHNPSKHPISHAIIFLTQSFTLLYFLLWLGFAEVMGVSIFFEMTSLLRVLSIELRNVQELCQGDENLLNSELCRLIKFHQQIILLSDRCNEIYNRAFIIQMLVNFILVSLSLLEVVEARKDPQVATEYLLVMTMTLGHLSFWSKFGDMFSEESEQVALAVYEAYDPTIGSKTINRQYCFFIQRAQRPLQMSASPFPPFNLMNYMFILKQCYSILTLLTNTLD